MNQVWKFPLQDDGFIANGVPGSIGMPSGSRVIHAGVQDGMICLWAIVPVGAQPVKRKFVVYGTGHDIERNDLDHIATFQSRELVFHIFEEKP